MKRINQTGAPATAREEDLRLQTFWTERGLYRTSARNGHRMKILFLGFQQQWAALLTGALQYNIFHPQQRIEYHVFGDCGSYPAGHTQLHAIGDPVIFHSDPPAPPLLEEARLVLRLGESGAENDLPAAVRLSRPSTGLCGKYGVLLDRAKRINLRYAHLYGGAPETEEAKEAQWRQLDDFTRGSNLCSAAYHEIRLEMLEAMGESAECVSPESMELLTELEHVRWCRYHYLNNWRRGTPADGKNKDAVRRIHEDLVPYAELTEADKEKDRENIRILLSLR